ncbi:hypothetical protein CYMTET_56478 [Cymbomonas tetramitiformis]|uniref:Uncharacterized protein n=1 Tax=Cymbomonas tetramitiformis TaxID=36881 RepID=A0AAE0BC90_9CHLO|nr:hypothetical protein CYMTET_56478 [Cymbomonas tetramitiformis]
MVVLAWIREAIWYPKWCCSRFPEEHWCAASVSGGRGALLEVCHHLAAGRAPEQVREWLVGPRLVALLTDNLGVTSGPITCGEVPPKLEVICKQRAKAFRARFCGGGPGLRAALMGVVVKGGADLGVYTVQAVLDRHPKWVCVKADATQECVECSLPRGRVFDAVERGLPGALGVDGPLLRVEEMPGAVRGELDFINVLGVPVEWPEAVTAKRQRRSLTGQMRERLQTVQKVSDAMGEIEEASGADEHLPPQAPKGANYFTQSSPSLVRVASAQIAGVSLIPQEPICWHAGGVPGAGGGNCLARRCRDDLAARIKYSPNHCLDAMVLDAEQPGQDVIFDMATFHGMEGGVGPAAVLRVCVEGLLGSLSENHKDGAKAGGAGCALESELVMGVRDPGRLAGARVPTVCRIGGMGIGGEAEPGPATGQVGEGGEGALIFDFMGPYATPAVLKAWGYSCLFELFGIEGLRLLAFKTAASFLMKNIDAMILNENSVSSWYEDHFSSHIQVQYRTIAAAGSIHEVFKSLHTQGEYSSMDGFETQRRRNRNHNQDDLVVDDDVDFDVDMDMDMDA